MVCELRAGVTRYIYMYIYIYIFLGGPMAAIYLVLGDMLVFCYAALMDGTGMTTATESWWL